MAEPVEARYVLPSTGSGIIMDGSACHQSTERIKLSTFRRLFTNPGQFTYPGGRPGRAVGSIDPRIPGLRRREARGPDVSGAFPAAPVAA